MKARPTGDQPPGGRAAREPASTREPRAPGTLRQAAEAVRRFALALPGAHEDYPWGERVVKVGRKVFVFLGRDDVDDEFGFSVKLPASGEGVLALPFATPTGYGLGRAGWVSVRATADAGLPVELMQSWVEESYRAVAPKKLVAQLPLRA